LRCRTTPDRSKPACRFLIPAGLLIGLRSRKWRVSLHGVKLRGVQADTHACWAGQRKLVFQSTSILTKK
jgi:hypothetical protein